jgi:hypothetical protein
VNRVSFIASSSDRLIICELILNNTLDAASGQVFLGKKLLNFQQLIGK